MLASWVSYCRIDDTAIFLDVRRNRYAAVPWAAARAIIQHDRCAIPGQLARKVDAWGWLDGKPAEQSLSRPEQVSLNELRPEFRSHFPLLQDVAKSVGLMAALRLRLAAFSLERVLADVSIRNSSIADPTRLEPAAVGSTLAAFQVAERFVLKGDMCLLRSLALQAALAKSRLPSTVVLGVKLHPFEAHCWLQHGTTLLNDTVERTGLFVPIRIVA